MTRIVFVGALVLLSLGLIFSLAQDEANGGAASPGLRVAEHDAHGSYLTDVEGMALYLFLNDEEGVSNCYDQCAENWPPLLVEESPEDAETAEQEGNGDDSEAGQAINDELLGTAQRDDEMLQLTYGGWPLYYFVRDQEPGDVNGQGVGEVWYLVSPEGEPIGADVDRDEAADEDADEAADDAAEDGDEETEQPEAEDEADAAEEPEEEAPADEAADAEEGDAGEAADETGGEDELFAALMSEGETIFRNICAACHGREGQGGVGPRLEGRGMLSRSFSVINTILWGIEPAMPGFADEFSDREVAAVATYVRNAWSNDHGLVEEEEVSEWRERGTR